MRERVRQLVLALWLAPTMAWLLGLATACNRAGEPTTPPPRLAEPAPQPPLALSTEQTRAAALRGELPAGAEVNILASRCAICHTTQYLTQQRLTGAQWTKTIEKMKKWGAPIDDAELAALVRYLGAHFPADLPDAPRAASMPTSPRAP